jgi:hypothetical protein
VYLAGFIVRDAKMYPINPRDEKEPRWMVNFTICWTKNRRSLDGGFIKNAHFFTVKAYMSKKQVDLVVPKLKDKNQVAVGGRLEYWKKVDENGKTHHMNHIVVDDPLGGITVSPKDYEFPPESSKKVLPINIYEDDE